MVAAGTGQILINSDPDLDVSRSSDAQADIMHADRDRRWTAPGNAVLHWESWGEQHAVFDSRSGETHMLPDPTSRALRHLARHPSTVREVAEHLCEDSGKVCDEQFLEQVAWLLLQLQNAGLIEKADR